MLVKIKAKVWNKWYTVVNIDKIFESRIQLLKSLSNDLDTNSESIDMYVDALMDAKKMLDETDTSRLIREEIEETPVYKIIQEKEFDSNVITSAQSIDIDGINYKIVDKIANEAGSLEVVIDCEITQDMEFNRLGVIEELFEMLYGDMKFNEINNNTYSKLDKVREELNHMESLLLTHSVKQVEEFGFENMDAYYEDLNQEKEEEKNYIPYIKAFGIFVLTIIITFAIFILSDLGG